MWVIVSPVGISLFLNVLKDDEGHIRRELIRHSNDGVLPEKIAQVVDELSERAKIQLKQGDVQKRRRISAELNGLYNLYDNQLRPNEDMHFLIATDTALGKRAAELIKWFLREVVHITNVSIIVPINLNTASIQAFSYGIKDLLKKFDELLPGYSAKGYEIVFNLTGGFKSLQGYLTIIGMFYADRLVYIFEGGRELVDIPRLPLKIDEDQLSSYAVSLALLAAGRIYPISSLKSLPEALLEVDESGYATLSDWGILVWTRLKEKILSQDRPLPFPRLEYERSFLHDFSKATPKQRVRIQETLARVSTLLEEHNGDISVLKRDGGIQYDNYSGQSGEIPIGHFRVSREERITCKYMEGKLYLRHYGSHDYTERVEGVR